MAGHRSTVRLEGLMSSPLGTIAGLVWMSRDWWRVPSSGAETLTGVMWLGELLPHPAPHHNQNKPSEPNLPCRAVLRITGAKRCGRRAGGPEHTQFGVRQVGGQTPLYQLEAVPPGGSYLTFRAPAFSSRRMRRIGALGTGLGIVPLLKASLMVLSFPVTH